MKRKERDIPKTTIQRLPLYYRALQKMGRMDVDVVSSKDLGERLDIPSTQVRKDLSYYGEFGRRGVGYEVSSLLKHLERILGLGKEWKVALVGAGNLGRALVNYPGFRKLGFQIAVVFDSDPEKIGQNLHQFEIKDIQAFGKTLEGEGVHLGIIAVPDRFAQEVADMMVKNGILGIWNFSPTRIRVPLDVVVRNEDLSVGLIGLLYQMLTE